MVKAWYLGLGDVAHAFMIKEQACWLRFKATMHRQWSLPTGLAIRNAKERRKRDNETFLEFFYVKLTLLKNVYPNCGGEGYIEMIKMSMDDSQVELWARELSDTTRFAAGLRQHDDHLARYPLKKHVSRESSHVFPFNTRSSYVSSKFPSTKSRVEKVVKGSDIKGDDVRTKKARRTNDDVIALNRKQVASIQKRKDDSGRMVDFFIKENSLVAFLRNSCSICAKSGSPDKWYFSFGCSRNKLSGARGGAAAPVKAEAMVSYFPGDSDSDDDEEEDLGNDGGEQE